jgi:hypothetical protein
MPDDNISYRRPVRYRAERLTENHYAVVERSTNKVIIAGFKSDREAWGWIAAQLGKRGEE